MAQHISSIQLWNGNLHTTDRGVTVTVDRDGLISFYPMEGPDETILEDESGHEHFGEILGASTAEGCAGEGLYFREDDVVEIEGGNELEFGYSDFTYCFYIIPERDGTVVGKHDGEQGFETRVENGKVKTILEDSEGRSVVESESVLSSESFSFIAIVRRSGTVTLYVDHSQEDSCPADHDLTNNSIFYLGNSPHNGGFQGILDELYLYGRALSDEDIKDIFFLYSGP